MPSTHLEIRGVGEGVGGVGGGLSGLEPGNLA